MNMVTLPSHRGQKVILMGSSKNMVTFTKSWRSGGNPNGVPLMSMVKFIRSPLSQVVKSVPGSTHSY